MDYRERLRGLRIDHDLEQEDIAQVCGVSRKTISHWETKRGHVPVECLIQLCNYYQISANYILGLPEYPVPN